MGKEREKREHDEALSLLEADISMHELLIEEEKLRLTEWGAEEKRKEREKIIDELKSAIRLIQQKPEVTEECVKEKAKQINTVMVKLRHVLYAEKMKQLKDFTRLFIEEIRGK